MAFDGSEQCSSLSKIHVRVIDRISAGGTRCQCNCEGVVEWVCTSIFSCLLPPRSRFPVPLLLEDVFANVLATRRAGIFNNVLRACFGGFNICSRSRDKKSRSWMINPAVTSKHPRWEVYSTIKLTFFL